MAMTLVSSRDPRDSQVGVHKPSPKPPYGEVTGCSEDI